LNQGGADVFSRQPLQKSPTRGGLARPHISDNQGNTLLAFDAVENTVEGLFAPMVEE
jgi:hypothetical protein